MFQVFRICSNRKSFLAAALGLLSMMISLPASSQIAEILEVNTPVETRNLEPGEAQVWSVYIPEGSYDFMIDAQGGSPTIIIEKGQSSPEVIENAFGYIGMGGYSPSGESWTVTIQAQETIGASYVIYLESFTNMSSGGDPFADDFGTGMDGNFFEDDSEFGQPGFGNPASMLSGFIDNVLTIFGRTVLPYLVLLIVQSITIFFVLRSMMSPANRLSSDETLSEQIASVQEARTGVIHFDERRHKDEIARFDDDRNRLHRLNKMNAYSRWWLLTIFVVFLIGSSVFVQNLTMAGAQILLALILWIYFALRGRPIGIGFAVFAGLVLAAPFLISRYMGTLLQIELRNGIIAIGGLLILLGLLIWRNRWRASKFPKQDLLVLRVFGMDQSAKETFSTIARNWSWLGASATIADPSYIKYMFSGWRGNVLKFVLVVLATILAGLASLVPAINALIPAGLSEIQRFSVLMLAAFVVLIPVITIPIFLQVRLSFIKNRDKLIDKINKLMGRKKRPNGYHRHRPFFCHDDLWRPAVQKMMEETEVLLMDFRGFDPSNLGCAYEVGKVVNTVDLDKVVLFVDDGTDKDVLYRIFESCWEQRTVNSPNAAKQEPVLNVYIGNQFVSWRDGIGRWLWSILTRRRWRRWAEDSRGIVARLSTVAPDEVAA